MAGAICGAGPYELARVEQVGERWCFRCRRRAEFTDCTYRSTDLFTYYGPFQVRRCAAGHTDGDLFPGYSREEV